MFLSKMMANSRERRQRVHARKLRAIARQWGLTVDDDSAFMSSPTGFGSRVPLDTVRMELRMSPPIGRRRPDMYVTWHTSHPGCGPVVTTVDARPQYTAYAAELLAIVNAGRWEVLRPGGRA